MQDYPIGAFLVWRTQPGKHPGLRFRRIVTNYGGKTAIPPGAHPPKAQPVFAVLDGQHSGSLR